MEISQQIDEAIRHENKTGALANALDLLARQSNRRLTKQQIQEGVNFIVEYIQHVPHFVAQATAKAISAGMGNQVIPLVNEICKYWSEEDDIIPDSVGLAGIMDDAYLSLSTFQALSMYSSATVGFPLLPVDLTQANLAIRNLIGEPAATQLDKMVAASLSKSLLKNMAAQLGRNRFSFVPQGNYTDPYWGNASINEVVDARLGAMGLTSWG